MGAKWPWLLLLTDENHLKLVFQTQQYSVPLVNVPLVVSVEVAAPEPVETCVTKVIKITEVVCKDIEEKKCFNVAKFEDAESDCYDNINRTNNGLESYNRRFNDLFESGKKPTLLTFVNKVEEESQNQAQRIHDIRENRRREVDRDLPTIPQVPIAYYRFRDNVQH